MPCRDSSGGEQESGAFRGEDGKSRNILFLVAGFVEPEAPHRTIFQTLGISSPCCRSMLRFKPENDQMWY